MVSKRSPKVQKYVCLCLPQKMQIASFIFQYASMYMREMNKYKFNIYNIFYISAMVMGHNQKHTKNFDIFQKKKLRKLSLGLTSTDK